MMTCQNKRKLIVKCHFYYVDHQVVRHTREMFSIYTHVFLSVQQN